MRHHKLHAALSAFAEEAAWQLAADTEAGDEVPFEIVEASGRRRDTPLYCYRPLTGAFIDEHELALSRLPSFPPAVQAIAAADGLDGYLLARGERRIAPPGRARAQQALGCFLRRLFEDQSDFTLVPERFERAYAELEDVVHEGRTETIVVVPVLGLVLGSDEVTIGDGLVLACGDVLDDVPDEAIWPRDGGDAHVVAVLRFDAAPGDPAPLDHARLALSRLLTALRLYDSASVALGPAAWTRSAGGPWHAVVLGLGTGRPTGEVFVPAVQEDELRAFVSLVTRRTPKSGEVAWALRRFELACVRPPTEALSDLLLALRALVEPEGPQSGRLPGRVAALCGGPDERAELTSRLAEIVRLERSVIAGVGPGPAALGPMTGELASHLRAILRDVLCGHLDPDLCRVADEIIAFAAELVEPSGI